MQIINVCAKIKNTGAYVAYLCITLDHKYIATCKLMQHCNENERILYAVIISYGYICILF